MFVNGYEKMKKRKKPQLDGWGSLHKNKNKNIKERFPIFGEIYGQDSWI
jgi:hypothetical protein